MALDFNTVALTDSLAFLSTTFPASAVLELRTGTQPGVGNAATGTLVASYTLAAGWAAAAAAARTLAGLPLTVNAAAAGIIGYFRVRNAGDTARFDGTAGASVVIATSALTAANGNVLTFAATTGVVVGMNVSGTGVLAGSAVIAVTGTTVTLSRSSTAGVANAASITFAYDLVLDNANVALNQPVNITALTVNQTDDQA